MTRKRWDSVFYNCPGAWVGNQPVDGIVGHITVDATRIVEAISYLRRRRVKIRRTRLSPGCEGGVQIEIGGGVA